MCVCMHVRVCVHGSLLHPPSPCAFPLQSGFIEYADTYLRAQQRRQQPLQQPQQERAGIWDAVAGIGAGIGAVGFGALLALGVRQAFQ